MVSSHYYQQFGLLVLLARFPALLLPAADWLLLRLAGSERGLGHFTTLESAIVAADRLQSYYIR